MSTKLFISACLSDETEASNIRRMAEMLEEVRDTIESAQYMPMRDVIGVWYGNVETSFEFTVSTLRQIELLKRLAWKYEQEAVLIVTGAGEAVLHNADGTMEYAGQWRELEEDEDKPDCYSIIKGVIYVCD